MKAARLFLLLTSSIILMIENAAATEASSLTYAPPNNQGNPLFVVVEKHKSRTVRRRRLEDERGDNYYDDEDDDDGNTLTDTMTDAKDRVEQDLQSMWTTSPSEWITEYWEVLGGIVLAVLLVLFICCAPICCCRIPPEDQLQVKTASEMTDAQLQKRQTKKDQKQDEPPKAMPAPVHIRDGQRRPQSRSLDQPILGINSSGDETDHSLVEDSTVSSWSEAPKKKRQRVSLWGEIVSVWTEICTGRDPLEEDFGNRRKVPNYVVGLYPNRKSRIRSKRFQNNGKKKQRSSNKRSEEQLQYKIMEEVQTIENREGLIV